MKFDKDKYLNLMVEALVEESFSDEHDEMVLNVLKQDIVELYNLKMTDLNSSRVYSGTLNLNVNKKSINITITKSDLSNIIYSGELFNYISSKENEKQKKIKYFLENIESIITKLKISKDNFLIGFSKTSLSSLEKFLEKVDGFILEDFLKNDKIYFYSTIDGFFVNVLEYKVSKILSLDDDDFLFEQLDYDIDASLMNSFYEIIKLINPDIQIRTNSPSFQLKYKNYKEFINVEIPNKETINNGFSTISKDISGFIHMIEENAKYEKNNTLIQNILNGFSLKGWNIISDGPMVDFDNKTVSNRFDYSNKKIKEEFIKELKPLNSKKTS